MGTKRGGAENAEKCRIIFDSIKFFDLRATLRSLRLRVSSAADKHRLTPNDGLIKVRTQTVSNRKS
jgi:hypothetical protein